MIRIGHRCWSGRVLVAIAVLVGFTLISDSDQQRASAQGAPAASRPFNPKLFVRAFRVGSEPQRFSAVMQVEQFYRNAAELPAALIEVIDLDLKRKRIGASTYFAARLFASIEDDELLEKQLALARSPNLTVATAAIEELAKRRVEEAFELAAGLANRDEFEQFYSLRHAIVHSIAQFPKKESVDFLIGIVEEHGGQLRYESACGLARLTGQNFGGHGEQWRKWWDKAERNFDFASVRKVDEKELEEIPWPEALPKFYGAPVYAARVVFVIDRSNSMRSSVKQVTRLTEAQKELEATIKIMPEGTLFNVIAYNNEVQIWARKLIEATPVTKAEAIGFAARFSPQGMTASYDSLDEALSQDRALEAVYFLSDGKPTAGSIINQDQIIAAITRRNANKRTSINTIAIDSKGKELDFLKTLSEKNFGEYRQIR